MSEPNDYFIQVQTRNNFVSIAFKPILNMYVCRPLKRSMH